MTFQPYNIVPGTQILHSTTDCYELWDEDDGINHRVELQCDNGGAYLKYIQKRVEGGSGARGIDTSKRVRIS